MDARLESRSPGDDAFPATTAWPSVLTLVLAAGALLPDAVLRDALTHAELPPGALTLSRPWAYTALAPFCETLDALTLLSVRQHAALIAAVVALVALWRLIRRWRRGRWDPWRDVAATAEGMLLLVVAYAAIIVPRPIAGLHVRDPDLVAVDFHSHTNASRDVRARFTPEHNRAWHRAGGWHAAYVTDHLRVDGASRAMAANPARAGDDTVLLPGVELRAGGMVFLVLGLTAEDLAAIEARRTSGGRAGERHEHAVIITIPVDLAQLRTRTRTRAGPIVGLEVSDAGLKGFDQMQREHEALMAAARKANLAPVAGSNTHGWSQTPPAWSLLRIPGWRALAPGALGARIETELRERRFTAVRTVERYAADAGATPLGLAATLPAVAWHMAATLTLAERLACLAWIWGAALAIRVLRPLRTPAGDDPGPRARACVRAPAE